MDVLAVGVDVVECLRIARMIERYGEQFINRVFTPAEVDYCNSRRHATQEFAGRWAAKEAILKLLGLTLRRGIGFRDIEIRADRSGRPIVGLRGGVRDVVLSQGIEELLVSVSHCRTHAVAYATALGKRPGGGRPDSLG
jgi:holo-[acyl-carrier protein] synthase